MGAETRLRGHRGGVRIRRLSTPVGVLNPWIRISGDATLSRMSAPAGRRSLIFDADDTLWENNVLFERVVEDYLDWLAHPTLDRGAIRAILDEIEAANTKNNGYGARAFLRNLGETFERLHQRPVSPRPSRSRSRTWPPLCCVTTSS